MNWYGSPIGSNAVAEKLCKLGVTSGQVVLMWRECQGLRGTRYEIQAWTVWQNGDLLYVARANRAGAIHLVEPSPFERTLWRDAEQVPCVRPAPGVTVSGGPVASPVAPVMPMAGAASETKRAVSEEKV